MLSCILAPRAPLLFRQSGTWRAISWAQVQDLHDLPGCHAPPVSALQWQLSRCLQGVTLQEQASKQPASRPQDMPGHKVTLLLGCRAVLVAMAMCMAGVVLITQPSFLGFAKSERSLLGIFFACLQALCSACAKMCVRHLRNFESPHVSVFYQAWVSLVIALSACIIPRAFFGHPQSIRPVHGWVEWVFMLGVGACAPARPQQGSRCWGCCSRVSGLGLHDAQPGMGYDSGLTARGRFACWRA